MVKKQTHWQYGALTGIILCGIIMLWSVLGFDEKGRVTLFPHLVFLIGLVVNAIAFSKANKARITFSDAFKSCLKASCVMVVFVVISYFILPHINPAAVQKNSDLSAIYSMEKQDTDKNLGDLLQYIAPLCVAFAYLVIGIFFSVIAALVAKKTKDISPAI